MDFEEERSLLLLSGKRLVDYRLPLESLLVLPPGSRHVIRPLSRLVRGLQRGQRGSRSTALQSGTEERLFPQQLQNLHSERTESQWTSTLGGVDADAGSDL